MANIHELSGETQSFKPAFQTAAQVLIEAELSSGREFFLCKDLFTTLNAEDAAAQKGVRLAILHDKRLKRVGDWGDGLYKVIWF